MGLLISTQFPQLCMTDTPLRIFTIAAYPAQALVPRSAFSQRAGENAFASSRGIANWITPDGDHVQHIHRVKGLCSWSKNASVSIPVDCGHGT